jgi:hypothetical protein
MSSEKTKEKCPACKVGFGHHGFSICKQCKGKFHNKCGILGVICRICVKAEQEMNGEMILLKGTGKCCGCYYPIQKQYAVCVVCKGKRHPGCGDNTTCRACKEKQEVEAMSGAIASQALRTKELMQDKYMYKRAAEENCAQVEKLETQLVATQNQSKKLKQNCAELQKSKKEAAVALANAATRIEGLIGGCAGKK